VNEFVNIDLLRHGEVAGEPGGGARYRGRTDDPLSPAGWEQMWAAVDGERHWQIVITSPLARCATFAHTIAERRSLPMRADERLREMDFGTWENRGTAELMVAEPDALTRFWQDPLTHSPPQGESLQAMHARVIAAWRDIVADGKTALVITHGGPIRIILCHSLGHPLARLLDIDVPQASLRRVQAHADEYCDARAYAP